MSLPYVQHVISVDTISTENSFDFSSYVQFIFVLSKGKKMILPVFHSERCIFVFG